MPTSQQESGYSKFRLRLSPYFKRYKCHMDIDNITLECLSDSLSLWHQGPKISKNVALVAYDERYIPKSDRDLRRAFRLFKELDITDITIIPFTPSILYGAVPQLGVRGLPKATPKASSLHRGVSSTI